MICKLCAWEADAYHASCACPECGALLSVRSGERLPKHRRADGRGRCPASSDTALWGHAACRGCDCRHLPVGSCLPPKEV